MVWLLEWGVSTGACLFTGWAEDITIWTILAVFCVPGWVILLYHRWAGAVKAGQGQGRPESKVHPKVIIQTRGLPSRDKTDDFKFSGFCICGFASLESFTILLESIKRCLLRVI